MSRIITEEQARVLDEKYGSTQATGSRQQRRALERASSKLEQRHKSITGIANGVVDRSLGGETHGLISGDEERAAKMKDVIRLMAMALAEYDQTKNAELMEYIEYRLSIRGRTTMQRKKWLYRAGVVVRFIAQIPAVRKLLERIHSALYGRPTPAPREDTATGDRG
jgi:hypothetical protein